MRERPILMSAPMVRAIIDGRKSQTRRVVKPVPHDVVTMVGADDAPTGEYGLVLEADAPRVIQRFIRCPYGVPGDLLWVREKHWGVERSGQGYTPHLIYDDEWDGGLPDEHAPLRPCGIAFGPHPSIHMPRWACRLVLHVTDVRVERLQDISEEDAKAEGASYGPADRHGDHDPRWILGRCRDCAHWDPRLSPNGGHRPSCPYYFHDRPDPQPAHGDAGQGCSTSFVLSDGGDETATFRYRHFWDHLNGGTLDGHWNANPWVWAVSFERVPEGEE